MPRKKLKFINKKHATSFQLVHRSREDPLAADAEAPQKVWRPVLTKKHQEKNEELLEELRNCGIQVEEEFDDEEEDQEAYLKDAKDNRVEWPDDVEEKLREIKIRRAKEEEDERIRKLAGENAESGKEEEVAETAVRFDRGLDPELEAAMEDDFDFDDPENQLEDDFIQIADGVASDQEEEEETAEEELNTKLNLDEEEEDDEESDDEIYSSEDGDDEDEQMKREKKNKRKNDKDKILMPPPPAPMPMPSPLATAENTNNSKMMLKSLYRMRRGLQQDLDEWDDLDIDSIDDDECAESTKAESTTSEFFADRCAKEMENWEKSDPLPEQDGTLKKRIMRLVQLQRKRKAEECVVVEVPDDEHQKWDVQSVTSRTSSYRFQPKTIAFPSNKKIRLSKKLGIPLDVLGTNKLTRKALDKLCEQNRETEDDMDSHQQRESNNSAEDRQSLRTTITELSMRSKNESPQERRERKRLLKEFKKERKVEKKANRKAFSEEMRNRMLDEVNRRINLQVRKKV